MDNLMRKPLRLMTFAGVMAVGGLALSVSGCATPSAGYADGACPEGMERVRIGPRGQAPKYICRDVN